LRARSAAALTTAALALAGASGALAAKPIVKHHSRAVTIAAGATRTVSVPYPDALEYANATYSGSVRVTAGRRSQLEILSRGSALGGSLYRVRARNTGSATLRIEVVATTVEPLPHG
jgi:hypothetical protein